MYKQNSFVGREDNAHDTKAHPQQETAGEKDEPAALHQCYWCFNFDLTHDLSLFTANLVIIQYLACW